jgi:sterol desaturase/sphingolipid hydroxylase (fatty acid hydroxylase superfamily)
VILIYLAMPVFLVTMLVEAWAIHARGARTPDGRAPLGYAPSDTAASLAMGIGNVLFKAAFAGATLAAYLAAYAARPWTLLDEHGGPAWAFLLLFFAEDLTYYAYHRAGHEVRLWWASHVNHHSSARYNLSTALRQSWTSPILGAPFWLPLAFLGFHPAWIAMASSVSLLYQYWIHTECIGKLGPLEWVFNTPSHHRVHHGTNVPYLDRNYGGILIVWDRLFGTFAEEEEPVTFGILHPLRSDHPVHVAFHEFAAIAHDLAAARTWRGRWGVVMGPPGWREDGRHETTAALRAPPPAAP